MPRPVLVVEPVAGLPDRPADVLPAVAHLAGRRRLTALSGSWSGTALLLAADPREVVERSGGLPSAEELAGLLERAGPLPGPGGGDAGLGAAGGRTAGRGVVGRGAVGGGWSVLLGHALGRSTGRVRTTGGPPGDPFLPHLVLARHDHVLRHDGSRWWAEALDDGDGAALGRALALAGEVVAAWDDQRPDGLRGVPGRAAAALVGAPDAAAHTGAVERVVDAVRSGEIAQANVCSRFSLRLADGGPAAVRAWAALVRTLAPERAVLVTGPWGALVGASPETYLSVADGRVTSAPIKGTRPAGEGDALQDSAKDVSENVMIVDLVRNDLARVCEPGSVRVDELLAVRPHTGVAHLVSTVSGTLKPGTGPAGLVGATFPPGSVTGTPKQRATEVTDAVEVAARGAHTGAAGFMSPRLADLAVTIRSLEVGPDGTAALGVGGGIVADSTPAEEWHEVLTKAAPLLHALGVPAVRPTAATAAHKGLADPGAGLLETVLAVDGRAVEVADHAARLRRSVWELTGRTLAADIEGLLHRGAARAGAGAHRLRVRVGLGPGPGVPVLEVQPWQVPVGPSRQPGLVLAVVDAPPHGLERHKYADRSFFGSALAGVVGAQQPDDVAFRAPDGLLETTRACLVAVLGGPDAPVLVTPACDGRVLPGTTRQVLVDLAVQRGWQVRLRALSDEVLTRADGLLACNALRGAQWVAEVGDHRWHGPAPALDVLGEALLRRWRLPAAGG